jgi:hypothetical protein
MIIIFACLIYVVVMLVCGPLQLELPHRRTPALKSNRFNGAAIQRRGSKLPWSVILSVYGADTIAIDLSIAAIQRRGSELPWSVILSVYGADTIAIDLSMAAIQRRGPNCHGA